MYFPSGPAKILASSRPADDPTIALVPNKRSTLFVVLKPKSFELWSIRPTTRLALVERSTSSLSKYGENVSLAWAPDGSSLVVLTSTSHVLDYVSEARNQPGHDLTPLNPPIPIEHITTFPPSAGEGFITPYAPASGSSSNWKHSAEDVHLDSALDDVQGGQAGEGPVKDGLFRYTYSSLGFGVDVVLNGIAKLGREKRVVPGAFTFLEGMPGRGTGLLMVLDDNDNDNEEDGDGFKRPAQQQIISVPYPLKPDHLVTEDPEIPANLPSTVALPTQTSTSISGAGTSTRFGAGFLGALALSGKSRRADEQERQTEWVALDADVEVNVDVVKWNVGTDIVLPEPIAHERVRTDHLEPTRTHGWYIGRTGGGGQVFLCRYHRPTSSRRSMSLLDGANAPSDWQTSRLWPVEGGGDGEDEVKVVSLNVRFGVYAVGLKSGKVVVIGLPRSGDAAVRVEWSIDQADLQIPDASGTGSVTSLAWTSDGCGLAVGWKRGLGIWTLSGRQTFFHHGANAETREDVDKKQINALDKFVGVEHLFWSAGNNELVALTTGPSSQSQAELSMLPIMRASSLGHLDPAQSEQPLFIADDTINIYRGRSWKPVALLDPQASPWQIVKVNSLYAAVQWPIRYCCISNDGTLLAVAGRNGLVHYSSNTGRWKMFTNETEEASFSVKGGMVWYYHVLIVATESARGTELRLYSRDQELSDANCLNVQQLPHTVVTMTLQGSMLLLLTSDNTLYHYTVMTTRDTIRLVIGDSMSLQGLNPSAGRVRAMCGFTAGHGDLGYDLLTSTIVLLAGSQLVVLEPKKGAHGGTRYESRLLASRVDSFYIYSGKSTGLRRSIWAMTNGNVAFWQDVAHERIIEIASPACPIAILYDSSLVVTFSNRIDSRPHLPFESIQQEMGVVLYLPQWLESFLRQGDVSLAHELAWASQTLPYFAHSLEMLLRATIEGAKRDDTFSNRAVRLLDSFPEGLDVAAAYTRKTEVENWGRLFELIGDPRELFDRCLQEPKRLQTASRYLIAIRHQSVSDGFEIHEDTTRLLQLAFEAGNIELCEEIIRFLDSVDPSGALKTRSLDVLSARLVSENIINMNMAVPQV